MLLLTYRSRLCCKFSSCLFGNKAVVIVIVIVVVAVEI